MATRGFIGYKKEDGTVVGVYSHWDNNIPFNGSILANNYKDINKIKKLISYGDISSLRENVDIPDGINHDFESPQIGITVFYGRDRGDRNVGPRTYNSIEEFYQAGLASDAKYVYVYDGSEWLVAQEDGPNFESVNSFLCEMWS